MKHLYVHIPFCRARCAYCDFASEPVGPHVRAGRVDRYLGALRAELAERAGAPAPGAPGAPGRPGRFETIYVGGGTPTVLPSADLVALVRDLAARLEPAPAGAAGTAVGGGPAGALPPEFTIEANPGTIDARLLERLAEAGVTRLSLGVQSFAPALRAALGRRVAQQEITDALAAIELTGWQEWNLDLVFGIPGQDWDLAAADLDAAVAARPAHISLYDLTYTSAYVAWLDAGPVGGGARSAVRGGARVAAAAFAEQHYGSAVARLEAAGYRRYEVSNFALPSHECRHNQAYWRGEDYLGIGASAVSTATTPAPAVTVAAPGEGEAPAPTAGAERRTNPQSVEGYLTGETPEIEVLTPWTRQWERAMLGLRTSEGVEEASVAQVVDPVARDRLLAQSCLERRCGKLRLNPGFLDVSNTVIGALLATPGD